MIEILLAVIAGCLITIAIRSSKGPASANGTEGPPGPMGMRGEGCDTCSNYKQRKKNEDL